MDKQAFYFRDFENAHIPEILHEIYTDKVYEPYIKGKKGLTIVDVGANIGLTTYYFSQFAETVYSIEPARDHIDCIMAMVKYNKLQNIKVLPYAISDITGPTFLYHSHNSTMNSLDPRLNTADYAEIVTALSIDKLFEMVGIEKIDLLKLDPEGAESAIISSEGFIKYVDKIPLIIGEWHTWGKLSKDDFKSQLEKLGYKFDWMQNISASIYIAIRL